MDRLYAALFVSSLIRVAGICATSVDARRIDGAVNGIGRVTLGTAQLLRRLQTGFVVNYALVMAGGAVAILAYLLLRR